MEQVEEKLRALLKSRGVLEKAAEQHEAWTRSLETKYPKGPRGGLHPLLRDARKIQEKIGRLGPDALADDMVPRFLYTAERWLQITDPDVIEEFPYLRYVCFHLPDSRPGHLEKHNLVLPIGHRFWDIWYPPNGAGCKCGTMSVSESHLKREGWRVSGDAIFEHEMPDRGFEFNVGKLLSLG